MGIRALCAAAAVVVASAAEAATYDVVLEITRNELLCDGDCLGPEPDAGPYEGFQLFEPVRGILDIVEVGPGAAQIYFTWGNVDEYLGDFEVSGAAFFKMFDAWAHVIEWDGKHGSIAYADHEDNSLGRYIDGTIQLAPVPLPATAALLPMGLGALALMRRRRKA